MQELSVKVVVNVFHSSKSKVTLLCMCVCVGQTDTRTAEEHLVVEERDGETLKCNISI